MPLTLALVSEVFFTPDGTGRLGTRLRQARASGADLAVLPELPLNSWSPATPDPVDADAEPPNGPRARTLAAAARDAGIAVLGGVIERDPQSGRRFNTAVLVDAHGGLVSSYRKMHLPEEPGFHESCHYEPGEVPPEVVRGLAMPLGIQICSDANRPTGTYLLAARGAEAILVPRATEASTFDRWRLVFRANALVSSCYVVSVARPSPERGVPLGGPSIVVGPDGDVVLETDDRLAFARLDGSVVAVAKRRYPGYLAWPAEVYARGWTG
ncbi:MAG: carbon-nitrogen hydrolase family protein [Betaproteobacteria bacterium]